MDSNTQTFLLIGLMFFSAAIIGYLLSLFAMIAIRVKGTGRSSFPVMRFVFGGILIGVGVTFFYSYLPQVISFS